MSTNLFIICNKLGLNISISEIVKREDAATFYKAWKVGKLTDRKERFSERKYFFKVLYLSEIKRLSLR